MAEPVSSTTSTGIASVIIVMLGPVIGPAVSEYATIFFAALAGSLWPLSARDDLTRTKGVLLIARLVLTSVVLTGSVVWWLQQKFNLPIAMLLSPVAFFIAFYGDDWRSLASRFFGWLGTLLPGAKS